MHTTTNDPTTLPPLTELRRQLDPLYRGISSTIRQLKNREEAVPQELRDLQVECTALDRRIDGLTDDPSADATGVDQEVNSLQARVGAALAQFKQ